MEPKPPSPPSPIEEKYSVERIKKFLLGELSGMELHQLEPQQMLAIAVTGFQQYEAGRYEQAETIFTALVTLEPHQSYYHTALGACAMAMENLEKAEAEFTKAISLNPKEVPPYVNRGEIFMRNGQLAMAVKDFQQAIRLDPDDPMIVRARMMATAATDVLKKAAPNPASRSTAAKGQAKVSAPAVGSKKK